MTDRTSARGFARVFETLLMVMPTESQLRSETAKALFDVATSGDFDFSPDDMNIDSTLKELGLITEDDGRKLKRVTLSCVVTYTTRVEVEREVDEDFDVHEALDNPDDEFTRSVTDEAALLAADDETGEVEVEVDNVVEVGKS